VEKEETREKIMAINLADSRKRIDEIDRQMAALFEERMKVVKEVANYKIETGKPVLDRKREEEKLAAMAELVEGEFNQTGIQELYSQMMSISRKYQYTLLTSVSENKIGMEREFVEKLPVKEGSRVAFYGVKGSYTEQAMEEFFGLPMKEIPSKTFKAVMQAVGDGEAEFGVLPIENSSTGSISDIYDLLLEYDNYIVGEHVVKIDHVLIGVPGTQLSDITEVYSHGQPFLQCRAYLESHPEWKLCEFGSTSGSARKIKEDNRKNQAAIASRRAAEYYGLEILAENISMEEENSTRFIVIAAKPLYVKNAGKISICFEVPHISGSLYHILSHFLYNRLNMTHIESRPIAGRNWEYRFFLDFEGNLAEAAVQNALTGIQAEANSLMVLGNYGGGKNKKG